MKNQIIYLSTYQSNFAPPSSFPSFDSDDLPQKSDRHKNVCQWITAVADAFVSAIIGSCIVICTITFLQIL